MSCSVLQCVAVCCGGLQRVAVCCSVLQTHDYVKTGSAMNGSVLHSGDPLHEEADRLAVEGADK